MKTFEEWSKDAVYVFKKDFPKALLTTYELYALNIVNSKSANGIDTAKRSTTDVEILDYFIKIECPL